MAEAFAYVTHFETSAGLTVADPPTPGWFNHGDQILALLDEHKPKVCVELGTWLGASAIPVARSIRRWGGVLTCIDTWTGDVNGAPSAQPPWMLLSCARNLLQAGVGANVRLTLAPSIKAAEWWSQPIDYLYVDADHTYESVLADLCAWVPYVREGGLILGDDYGNDMYPGVRAAWDRFEREQDVALTRYQSTPADPHGIQLIYGTV